MERIWIYQADRLLEQQEQALILERLEDFTGQWRAHGKALAARAEIRHGLFVIITVDDQVAPPTGCSIDKSVHLLKELEQETGIGFFDRMRIAYRRPGDGALALVSRDVFGQLMEEGQVDGDTVVFNNLVSSYADLESRWEVPLSQSWHAKIFAPKPGV